MNIELKPNNVPTKPGQYILLVPGAVDPEPHVNMVVETVDGLFLTMNGGRVQCPLRLLGSSALWSDPLTFSVPTKEEGE